MPVHHQQNIAIIGGYGFLGTHLSNSLLKKNHYKNIYIVGKNKIKRYELVGSSFIHKECAYKDLSIILSTIDAVVYLAWNSTPFSSFSKNSKDDNLSSLNEYLVLLNKIGIQKFIFVSSAGALYKSVRRVVFTEETECPVESPYALEKLKAEKRISSVLNSQCLVYHLRPSNIYGPGQLFKNGMGLIPKLFDCVRKAETITLYEPLESERDYLYVSDFISALECFLLTPINSGIYNIAYDSNVSLGELIGKIEKLVGRKIDPAIELKNKGNKSLICTNKLKGITNWNAKVSISEGIALTKIKEDS